MYVGGREKKRSNNEWSFFLFVPILLSFSFAFSVQMGLLWVEGRVGIIEGGVQGGRYISRKILFVCFLFCYAHPTTSNTYSNIRFRPFFISSIQLKVHKQQREERINQKTSF